MDDRIIGTRGTAIHIRTEFQHVLSDFTEKPMLHKSPIKVMAKIESHQNN